MYKTLALLLFIPVLHLAPAAASEGGPVSTELEEDNRTEQQIRHADVDALQADAKPASDSDTWRLDPFGGYSALSLSLGDENVRLHGWGAGATARFLPALPWLGITGSVSQNWRDGVRFNHYRVGASVTSSYGGDYLARGFAHALVGNSSASSPDAPAAGGFALTVGAGLDMFAIVRLQVDWVRMNLPDYPSDSVSFFAGVVIPLCFGGGDDDCLVIK